MSLVDQQCLIKRTRKVVKDFDELKIIVARILVLKYSQCLKKNEVQVLLPF